LRELINWRGAEFVRLGHGASGVICICQIASWKPRLVCRLSCLCYGEHDLCLDLGYGIVGEGPAEILHDIEAVTAANHT